MEQNIGSDYVAPQEDQLLNPLAANKKVSKIENISRRLLIFLAFLLPIFFVPSTSFPFLAGKWVLVSIVVLLSFFLWIVSKLRSGSIQLPKSVIFYSLGFILLSGLVSTVFSGSIGESFLGNGGEINTYFFTLVLFLLLITVSKVFNSSKAVLNFYLALFISIAIVIIYQFLRVFLGVDFLSFGILNSPTSTLLGRWNDLGIIFGLLTLVSVTTLEFFKPAKLMKVLLYVFTVLSLLFMAIINSILSWIVLGVLFLILFIYLYLQGKSRDFEGESFSKPKRFSKLSATVFVVAVVFIILRPQVGDFVSGQFGISQIEARPSLTSTLGVAKNVLSQSPGFGAGPNRFGIEWGIHKPLGVNNLEC